MMIIDDCINCGVCECECPNSAISEGDGIYMIDGDKCTECIGHFEDSRCIDVCPVDSVIADPDRTESLSELREKYERLEVYSKGKA